MQVITRNNTNTLTFSLAELQTLNSPTFLLEFINEVTGAVETCIAPDVSAYPARFNEFIVTENDTPDNLNAEVNLPLAGYYIYKIYEQTSTTNLDPTMADNELEVGKIRVLIDGDRYGTTYNQYFPPNEGTAIWDNFASEGIVQFPPTPGCDAALYENSDQSFTQSISSGATYTAPDITVTDSDGSTFTQPANTDVICSIDNSTFIKGIFLDTQETLGTITIDTDNAGTYTSITDDGSSGSIELNINSGGFAAFVNPTVLASGDTLEVRRTTYTATGFYKIIGTFA